MQSSMHLFYVNNTFIWNQFWYIVVCLVLSSLYTTNSPSCTTTRTTSTCCFSLMLLYYARFLWPDVLRVPLISCTRTLKVFALNQRARVLPCNCNGMKFFKMLGRWCTVKVQSFKTIFSLGLVVDGRQIIYLYRKAITAQNSTVLENPNCKYWA